MSTDTILVLEDRRYQAMIDADLAAPDELCAPNLRYTHTNGAHDTKESLLKEVDDGYFDYRRIDHPVATRVMAPTGTSGTIAVPTFGHSVDMKVNGHRVWSREHAIGSAALHGDYIDLAVGAGTYNITTGRD